MAKIIHTMIRVLSPEKSIHFYQEVFDLTVADRFDFDDFSLIYLRNAESDMELELTYNHGRTEPYAHTHSVSYGHMAVVVDDVAEEHCRLFELGYILGEVVDVKREGKLFARYFFIRDPDDYEIEILERVGRYQ